MTTGEGHRTVQADRARVVGRVIDTALTASATMIGGVHYEAPARAAGGSLGDLIELSTSPRSGGVEYAAMARMRSAPFMGPTPISPREIEVRQHVTARWRFVPGRR